MLIEQIERNRTACEVSLKLDEAPDDLVKVPGILSLTKKAVTEFAGKVYSQDDLKTYVKANTVLCTEEEQELKFLSVLKHFRAIENYIRGKSILERKISEEFFFSSQSLTARAEFLIEEDGYKSVFYVIKNCSYSTRARSEKNQVSKSFLLYGLALLAASKGAHTIYLFDIKDDKIHEFSVSSIMSNSFSLEIGINELLKRKQDLNLASFSCSEQSSCKSCSMDYICNFKTKGTASVSKKKENKVTAVKKKGEIKHTLEQIKVINFRSGVARVNAVAGAGKTATLVKRLEDMIKEGCNPDEILVISFTDRSVKEFKEKLQSNSFNNVFTFNGFGQHLMEKYFQELGFEKNPEVNEVKELICIKDSVPKDIDIPEFFGKSIEYPLLNMINAKGFYIRLQSMFSAMKKAKVSMMGEIPKLFPELKEDRETVTFLFKAYSSYVKLMKKRSLITFDEQVLYLQRIIQKYKEDFYFKHVIVDEAQDSDSTQIKILETLYEKSESIMFVGDDLQSIYGFRGVTSELFIDIDKCFLEYVQNFDLTRTFRCPQSIAYTANRISGKVRKKVKKEIVSASPEKGYVGYFNSENHSKKRVIDIMEESLRNKESVAILTRTNKNIEEWSEELKKASIPFTSAIDRNKEDLCTAVYEIIEYFLTKNTRKILFPLLLKNNCTLEQLMTSGTFETEKETVDKIIRDTLEEGLLEKDVIYALLDYFNLSEHSEIFKENQCFSLSDINFINQVVKSSNNKVFKTKIDDIDMDGIFISTIHSTKGAEFDTVLVDVDSFKRTSLKFLEKDARYTLTEEDFEALDEELKILYVAVTRAKKSLLLFDSRRLIA